MANKMGEWSASERKSAQTSAKAWQDFFVKGGATQQTELEALGRVVEVRQLHEAELLALDGVVGVAESYKVKAGTERLARYRRSQEHADRDRQQAQQGNQCRPR